MNALLDAPVGLLNSLSPDGDDIVEMPLLLSQEQMTALETAAHARGVSAASLARQVLTQFLRRDTPRAK